MVAALKRDKQGQASAPEVIGKRGHPRLAGHSLSRVSRPERSQRVQSALDFRSTLRKPGLHSRQWLSRRFSRQSETETRWGYAIRVIDVGFERLDCLTDSARQRRRTGALMIGCKLIGWRGTGDVNISKTESIKGAMRFVISHKDVFSVAIHLSWAPRKFFRFNQYTTVIEGRAPPAA